MLLVAGFESNLNQSASSLLDDHASLVDEGLALTFESKVARSRYDAHISSIELSHVISEFVLPRVITLQGLEAWAVKRLQLAVTVGVEPTSQGSKARMRGCPVLCRLLAFVPAFRALISPVRFSPCSDLHRAVVWLPPTRC